MIHLITYGDKNFVKSKVRFFNEANDTGWFDTITLYGPEDIDNDFKENFKDILSMERGGGYWIWKPYFIKKRLDEIEDNDILIYLDCGFEIKKKYYKEFDYYIDMIKKNNEGNISFQYPSIFNLECRWTSKKIFEYFKLDVNGKVGKSGQIVGGCQIIKKNEKSKKRYETVMKVLYDNPLLITDVYNEKKMNHKEFVDNRHDQSIFSIIMKLQGSRLISTEYLIRGPFKWSRLWDEKL